MTNILSIERDWVPILANAEESDYGLTHLNTAMRRIDITCKFIAPLAISSVVAVVKPAKAAIMIMSISGLSVIAESQLVLKVWKHNNRIRASKDQTRGHDGDIELDQFNTPSASKQSRAQQLVAMLVAKGHKALRHSLDLIQANADGLRYYFSTSVWLPSICVGILHGSVLAWSGTLITWLLNAHFSLAEVTIAKGVGSVFEIGSTLLFPWAVGTLLLKSPSQNPAGSYQMVERHSGDSDDEEESLNHDSEHLSDKLDQDNTAADRFLQHRQLHAAVIRVARWSIAALFLFLVPTTIALFVLNHDIDSSPSLASDRDPPSPLTTSTSMAAAAIAFWSFLSLSFLGRWTYDLAATQLTQMLVPATHRAAFGGTEQAIVSIISLVHWVAAAIWHHQTDFVWLAFASALAVGGATIAFVGWSRLVLADFSGNVVRHRPSR